MTTIALTIAPATAPIAPTVPIDPIDPTAPIDPIDPTQPIEPIDPMLPIEPTEAIDPIDQKLAREATPPAYARSSSATQPSANAICPKANAMPSEDAPNSSARPTPIPKEPSARKICAGNRTRRRLTGRDGY